MKIIFWSNALFLIFTFDSTLSNNNYLFASLEKGGPWLQYNFYSADLSQNSQGLCCLILLT